MTSETSQRNGGYTNNFAYDNAAASGPGNPTTFRGKTNTYNADNQLTAAGANSGFTYNGNGSPTSYQGGSLIFDAQNHIRQFNNSLQSFYRSDGLRAWKAKADLTNKHWFLYDGASPVCELDSSGNVLAWNLWGANGLAGRQAGSTSATFVYYTFDPQGNTTQRLDVNQNVLSSSTYDGYGMQAGNDTSGDPYGGFGGQAGYYKDVETGLYLLGMRYYDPGTGRFISRDPMGYGAGANLYRYCHNNPVNGLDPLGLFGWQDALNMLGKGLTRGISIGGAGWLFTGGGGFDVGFATDQSGTVGITYDYWAGSGLGSAGIGPSLGAFFSPGSLGDPDVNGTVQYSNSFVGVATSLPLDGPIGGGSITGSPNSSPTLQVNTPGRPYYAATVYGHNGFVGFNLWASIVSLYTGKSRDYFSPDLLNLGKHNSSCKQF